MTQIEIRDDNKSYFVNHTELEYVEIRFEKNSEEFLQVNIFNLQFFANTLKVKKKGKDPRYVELATVLRNHQSEIIEKLELNKNQIEQQRKIMFPE